LKIDAVHVMTGLRFREADNGVEALADTHSITDTVPNLLAANREVVNATLGHRDTRCADWEWLKCVLTKQTKNLPTFRE
jgi:hypothetical protein